jgi:hypothetical protein
MISLENPRHQKCSSVIKILSVVLPEISELAVVTEKNHLLALKD